MAYYLVRALPDWQKLPGLRARLDAGEIARYRPFGRAMTFSLQRAKIEDDKAAVWEEEDYCHPPLAQERENVLDKYFKIISISIVAEGSGWEQIEDFPCLWEWLNQREK